MNFFPMFLNIKNREILICGGGKHAFEKIERLLPFSPFIRVISENISHQIRQFQGIIIEERQFLPDDLINDPAFVIAAEEYDENRRIAEQCRKRHIPVNVVDTPSLCDFIFPAIISTGQLCIGISTGGTSPTAAINLKQQISEIVPSNIDDILTWMISAREIVKGELPKEKQNKALQTIVKIAFSENRPLNDKEVRKIISEQCQILSNDKKYNS